MSPRALWCIGSVAAAFLIAGVLLSHLVEPDVSVLKLTIAGNTPALQFGPKKPGPHPVALLAHGIFCSKEMLFCYGEALAHAGFECTSVDLPGHGGSPQRFTSVAIGDSLAADARGIGPVDVFIGHSMGCYAGQEAVREDGLRPRLFIAIGALPALDPPATPLLLMSGQFDEFIRPDWVRARTDARVEIFPWCDHVLELYDPRLVNAAVKAACAAVGKVPPAEPVHWRWRLMGMVLGWLGAAGLAKVALVLCRSSVRWARWRVPLFSIILLCANVLVTGTWIGAAPHLRRLPVQIAFGIIFWLLVTVLGRLNLPRWSLLAFEGAVTILSAMAGAHGFILFGAFFFLILLAATVCAAIVSGQGSRRDGDITLGIFAGYAVGQWMVLFF